jgi:hypothetical protein
MVYQIVLELVPVNSMVVEVEVDFLATLMSLHIPHQEAVLV